MLFELPDVRIFVWAFGQTRTNRIVRDVLRDGSDVISIAQDALEIALLPQALTAAPSMDSTRSLLGHLREAPQIRIRCQAFHEQMGVVWHQAIGKNRELLDGRSSPELLQGLCRGSRIR